MGAEYTFNSNDGYFEGLVRGFRAGIITQEDYTNLTQCETLEGKVGRKTGNVKNNVWRNIQFFLYMDWMVR